jgi:hypothetical protein
MLGARLVKQSVILAISIPLLVGCSPLRTWDAHTTSSPMLPPLDVVSLAREPVATLGVVAPSGLQGFGPALSLALAAALADVTPSMRALPAVDTLNTLNEQGLTGPYADLLSGFVRSGVLERKRLQACGSTLRSRYVLLPGLAGFDEILVDHFEITGLKVVRTRISTLRLWLQLWDAQTGRKLWESAGEARVASEVLIPDRTVPFDETARKLWLRMIREGLLGERTRAVQRRFQ